MIRLSDTEAALAALVLLAAGALLGFVLGIWRGERSWVRKELARRVGEFGADTRTRFVDAVASDGADRVRERQERVSGLRVINGGRRSA